MSLIFKKGDVENLENYHPISLMNVDYIILAFALANRIHKVIGKLINPNQVAYIHNQFIGTNIRLINARSNFASPLKYNANRLPDILAALGKSRN